MHDLRFQDSRNDLWPILDLGDWSRSPVKTHPRIWRTLAVSKLIFLDLTLARKMTITFSKELKIRCCLSHWKEDSKIFLTRYGSPSSSLGIGVSGLENLPQIRNQENIWIWQVQSPTWLLSLQVGPMGF